MTTARTVSVEAVLFDLDGVLVDSEPVHLEAERRLFAQHGAELTDEIKAPFVGRGGREVLLGLAGHFGLDLDPADMGRRKVALFLELAVQVRGFGPTGALVRALKERGIALAVASGSPPEVIAASLAAIGLEAHLPVQVSAEQVVLGKPAPDVFLLAAQRLGVAPASCVVVEDTVHGVDAARAAGMRCVAIPSIRDPWDAALDGADLLVRGGMAEADADVLLAWILGPGPGPTRA